MRKYLEDRKIGKIKPSDDSHKNSTYEARTRKMVDKNFDNLLWMAENCPEMLKDEEWEIDKFGKITHRRLIMLMKVLKSMYPDVTPQLIRLQEDVKY